MLIDLTEDERQVILLALAHLAVERPGWDHYLTGVARRLQGEVLFTEFRAYHTQGVSQAPFPDPPGAPQQKDPPTGGVSHG